MSTTDRVGYGAYSSHSSFTADTTHSNSCYSCYRQLKQWAQCLPLDLLGLLNSVILAARGEW
ncbi:MAG: hypothetical protein ACI9WS_003105 [Paraglaciecola psychrophila]|jgi:hypothetical protein